MQLVFAGICMAADNSRQSSKSPYRMGSVDGWRMIMKARVFVTLKTGVLDPQGKAIEGALKSLAIDGVESVRQGKVFDIELGSSNSAKAEQILRDACEKLLANTVIENYSIDLVS
jgi:phosphoribosylformylglycinamidine synthase subunit PurS